MSAQNRISGYSIFGPRPSRGVAVPAAAKTLPPCTPTKSRDLEFLAKPESRLVGMFRSLGVLFSRSCFRAPYGSVPFFRSTRIPQFRLAGRSFVASAVFHGSFVALLVCLHSAMPVFVPEVSERQEIPPREMIYFRVPLINPKEALAKPAQEKEPEPPAPSTPAEHSSAPSLEPTADAARPPSTSSYGKLTIVSKPSRPDNFHQTIIQPLSPPDVKIPNDVKVPNIVLLMGKAPDPAKPGFAMTPVDTKAVQVNRQAATLAAPTIALSPAPAVLPVSTPDVAKPGFALKPVDAKAVQVARQAATVDAPSLATIQPAAVLPIGKQADIAKPDFAMNPSNAKAVRTARQAPTVDAPNLTPAQAAPALDIGKTVDLVKPAFAMSPSSAKAVAGARQATAVEAPKVDTSLSGAPAPAIPGQAAAQLKLPIPGAVAAGPIARTSSSVGQAQVQGAPMIAAPTQNYGLVALGINPSDPGTEVILPPGNRSGDFSISPVGSKTTSASDASAANSSGAGRAGPANSNENRSRASGSAASRNDAGTTGTMNGNKGFEGSLSISGPAGDDGQALLQALGAGIVYPVPAALLPRARKNQLVVSTGPLGGGGLNLYGAMPCGRVDTVFLQMPGGDWTLEYCEPKTAAAPAASAAVRTQNQPTVIHLENPLTPPDAETRFDFQRTPVPPEKARKLIVLKGVLHDDGSVDQVQIYQGLVPQMDEAARLALTQWKFKPALREGKPVTVNIMVGIPAQVSAPQ